MIQIPTRATFSLAGNFRAFVNKIRPPQSRRDAAKTYPTIVRDFLERTSKLLTIEPHSKLTGSYGRRIAIHEIKDVDFVVYVDEVYAELGALKALEDLKAALEEFADEREEDTGERPEIELRPQRRSVRVHFTSADFFLDVVPVRAPAGTDAPRLLVPDREWKTWQPTAPIAYGERFSELNQGVCEELLVPLMKVIKHWRSMWLQRNQAKSYWVEAMIVNLIVADRIAFAEKSLAEVIAATFVAIRDECTPYLDGTGTPVVRDPMLPIENPNVAFNWDRGDFETFMRRIEEACTHSTAAIEAETATNAVAAWQKLFGEEWFPATVDDEAREAKVAAFSSAVTIGSTGAVFTRTPPATERVTQGRDHRFHGDEGQ